MQAALKAIQQEGYLMQEEDLAHLWPIRFAHIHRYGKYEFDIESAWIRVGLRPLKLWSRVTAHFRPVASGGPWSTSSILPRFDIAVVSCDHSADHSGRGGHARWQNN
jgi:hypothetical protein